tara:strand:+ start:1100 stop:1324 length:225 start_codon:yes stop_codon:yes gene_type:complete
MISTSSTTSSNLSFLRNVIALIGTLVIMHYLNQVHSTAECKVAEKQADFIYKYNVFTLCLSLATILALWFGIII